MRDFFVGLLVYPFMLLVGLLEALLGFSLVLAPLCVHLATKGAPRSYDGWFSVFSSVPCGRRAFSSLIGVIAPYTASIGATLQEVSASSVTASMPDRPWLRNPFSSVHAIALANLGELTTGIAVLSALQGLKSVRGIPVAVNTSYEKKARTPRRLAQTHMPVFLPLWTRHLRHPAPPAPARRSADTAASPPPPTRRRGAPSRAPAPWPACSRRSETCRSRAESRSRAS